jgi:serine/threonine protein kinase
VPDIVESASPVKEGDIIDEKYRVERILGMGGMGVVVAAMHVELEQRVALKFLLPQAASHPDVAARFAREARAAAKIRCEHVARVIDVSKLPDGAPYMVMEYMDGEDLEHVLARCGPMPVDMATSYVLQATEAIAEAHALGIVHRDLKPANLFLANRPNGDPIVKVLDFGISKSTLSSSQAQLTKTSSIMGSPLYMSPEQMTSAKSVDTRSDIWALGVVLYELLTRSTPFPAETMPELVAAILQRTQDPVRNARPDVPPQLEAIINRCLEKNPAGRFPNVAELAVALAPFGRYGSDVSVQRITHVLTRAGVTMSNVMPGAPAMAGMGSGGGTGQPHGSPQQPIGAATNSPWAQSVAGGAGVAKPSRVGLYVGVPVMLLVTAAAAAFFILKKPVAPAPTLASVDPVASSAPSAAATTSPPPAPSATQTAASSTPAPSAEPSPAVAAAPATPATPSQPAAAGHHDSAKPPASPANPASPAITKPAAPAAPASSGPVCKTVSFIDADGNKRFTRECK